ncbi:putative disease resistance protein rga4 [Quercus suber]|uniref:Disease resistance protein rga4 n=1 Tax=Quercus suber TaxID=58331 RepID=A0AAW0LUR6_QUESU
MTGKRSSLIKYPKDGVIHSKVMQRICVIIGDGLLASRGGINLATTIAGISLFCRIYQALDFSGFTQNLKFRPYSKLSGLAIVQHVPELQNQLKQRTGLGAKFRPYCVIGQELSELLNHLTSHAERIKDKLGLPCSKLYGLEIKASTVLDSMNRRKFDLRITPFFFSFSLRELYIKRCDGLGSVHWIGILILLQSLNIWECPKLMSLPQGIRNLTSLYELGIDNCPKLMSLPQRSHNLTPLKKCKRQTGEDWPIIAHVPYMYVDGLIHQEETIFQIRTPIFLFLTVATYMISSHKWRRKDNIYIFERKILGASFLVLPTNCFNIGQLFFWIYTMCCIMYDSSYTYV